MTSIDQLIGKGAKRISMDAVRSNRPPYACADADMTLRLAEKLEPEIKRRTWARFFMRWKDAARESSGRHGAGGTRIDRPYWKRWTEMRSQADRSKKRSISWPAKRSTSTLRNQLSTILLRN